MDFVINLPHWVKYIEVICVLTSFCIASFGGIGLIIQARDALHLKRYISFIVSLFIWIAGSLGYIIMAYYYLNPTLV